MISNGTARRIASEWRGGQASALYSFSSTGQIFDLTARTLLGEAESELETTIVVRDAYMRDHPERTAAPLSLEKSVNELKQLLIYVEHEMEIRNLV